jgi:hypothetical protein
MAELIKLVIRAGEEETFDVEIDKHSTVKNLKVHIETH